MSQSTPLTWDRWKQLLLPKGWYYYDGSLTSPASPCGVHCWIINHGADGLLFHIQKGAKYLTLEIPETMYQMMSLLHGLKIPLRSNPVHPPNPHSGKPVEKTEQVSNQADTRT